MIRKENTGRTLATAMLGGLMIVLLTCMVGAPPTNSICPSSLHASDFNGDYQAAVDRLDAHLEDIQWMNNKGFNDLDPAITTHMNAALQSLEDANELYNAGNISGANAKLALAALELDTLDGLIDAELAAVNQAIQQDIAVTVAVVAGLAALMLLLVFFTVKRKKERAEAILNAEIDYEALDQNTRAKENGE